jgi:hypothetical protein
METYVTGVILTGTGEMEGYLSPLPHSAIPQIGNRESRVFRTGGS